MKSESRINELDFNGNDSCYENNFGRTIDSDIDEISVSDKDYSRVTVYARDWTVDTLISQIQQENIDLDPEFQRRNAWDDKRRSRLIESLIYGLPVPEIVLAEDRNHRRKFIVLDGKQRLLTIAGFCHPEKYKTWNKPKLQDLKNSHDLNGKSYSDFCDNNDENKRFLDNALLRCSIIVNYPSEDVLFDIFYRLNSGSVPLTTQELRQVLNRGGFSNFLIQETSEVTCLHKVLKISSAHKRFLDAELLLRLIAFNFYWNEYDGNLKLFLDNALKRINEKWEDVKGDVISTTKKIYATIELLSDIFGDYTKIGRKYIDFEVQETRFNRSLFEVLLLCFFEVDSKCSKDKFSNFISKFKDECVSNISFRLSIEATTKSIQSYHDRFTVIKEIINDVFNEKIDKYNFRR